MRIKNHMMIEHIPVMQEEPRNVWATVIGIAAGAALAVWCAAMFAVAFVAF